MSKVKNLLIDGYNIKFGIWISELSNESERDSLIYKLSAIIQRYKSIFTDNDRVFIGNIKFDQEFSIDTISEMKNIISNELTVTDNEKIKAGVSQLLDSKIIKESTSKYSSPILSPDNEANLSGICIDYSYLNSITKDFLPDLNDESQIDLSSREDLIDKLAPSSLFTKIILKNPYYQLKLDEESAKKTAFVTDWGKIYEFRTVYPGLKNSVSWVNYVLDQILNKDLSSIESNFSRLNNETYKNSIKIYLDQILIHTDPLIYPKSESSDLLIKDNIDTHIYILEIILARLKSINFQIDVSTSYFLVPEISFVGRKLTKDGITVASIILIKILKYPQPKTHEELDCFLELVDEYKSYLNSLYLDDLNTFIETILIVHETNEFIWTEKAGEMFLRIKNLFANFVIKKPFSTRDESKIIDENLNIKKLKIDEKDLLKISNNIKKILESGDNEIVLESSDKEIILESGDKEIILESSDKEIILESGDKEIILESSDKEIILESGDKEIILESGDKEKDLLKE